jgi:2-polyprenyl-6-methoxyphenol hydroxylase-like FAD-dependent oxidoreductase
LFDADVVILGGGPAGSAVAITCAGTGLSVVVLERDERHPVTPGEALHPGVEPLLHRLGVGKQVLAAGFVRHPGQVVRWGGLEHFQPFGEDGMGPWLGFQAWRPTFDAILLDRARELGAMVIRPCQVRDIVVEESTVTGVVTSAGSFRCRFTVDATGRWRAMSRRLGLTWDRYGPARRVWYGYVSGSHPDRAHAPALIADAKGWTWVARVRPQTFQWVRLNFDNRRPVSVPSELRGLTPCGAVRGADVTWCVARRPAGLGYFLGGDAASVLDPVSSHGVLKALMSGMMIGHLIGHVIRGALLPTAALDGYARWMHNWFAQDVTRVTELYAKLPRVDPVDRSLQLSPGVLAAVPVG